MSKFMNSGGDNAAPNYVNYTEKRSFAPHDNTVSIAISGVKRTAQYDPRYERKNNLPYINGQTHWAGSNVHNAQGIAPRNRNGK